jgi:hypothetical protein
MPPRSRAFITAVNATLSGFAGLVVGGFGVDLIRLRRPDFELDSLLAAAIGAGVGWVVGAVVTWRVARRRRAASRGDIALFVAGTAIVLFLGTWAAETVRSLSFGPMIDEPIPDRHLIPTVAKAFMLDAALAALTFLVLALTRTSSRKS